MKKIVIKIGSGTLLTKRGRLDEFRLMHFAEQIRKLQALGTGVVLVISGAVACGIRHSTGNRQEDTARRIAAGIGQIDVMSVLSRIFRSKRITVAQILLTSHVIDSVSQRQKVRTPIDQYLRAGIVPIVNENDVIELNGFGGNDLLAVHVATLMSAEQVLILSQMAASAHGIGGGETKREALRVLKAEGIKASIVNGKDKDVILENIL